MQAIARNCRNQSPMLREKPKRLKPRGESTEAEHWGGPARKSEEGPVMVATRTSPRGSGCSVLLRRWEKVLEVICELTKRQPVYRRHELNSGFGGERENLA